MSSPSFSRSVPATSGGLATSAAVPRLWALIPCAGSGARAAAAGPKQYQPVAGQPMVLHTLAAFAAVPRLHGTALVVAPGDDFFDRHPVGAQVLPCGGASRAASVGNGLQALRGLGAADADWVLVHDAARCLITAAQIDALIDACLGDPVGGLLALPLPDTLKQQLPVSADGAAGPGAARVAQTLERSHKWLAQTPQMFRLGALLAALQQCGDAVTDESSAMEAQGLQPLLVEGSAQNFKVTYPPDFALAQAVLQSRR